MSTPKDQQRTNVLIIGQGGRLEYEALIFAASFFLFNQENRFRLFVAEPQPGPLWPHDPRMKSEGVRRLLKELGATILPFESRHFGKAYPFGNKIEALFALPKDEPFVFFDTDTLILGDLADVPFDYARPSASLRREGTWPKLELYGPGYTEIWRALYARFGLDFESSLDLDQPDEHWRRYLYFNAGFFYFRCPRDFGQTFLTYALSIRDAPPPELALQPLDPWLDQIALPLAIHKFKGGRDTLPAGWLDGRTSCHYRTLPLLYARESHDVLEVLEGIVAQKPIKSVLKEYEPFRLMLFQGRGQRARAMFDQSDLPRKEQAIRNRLRREGLWIR